MITIHSIILLFKHPYYNINIISGKLVKSYKTLPFSPDKEKEENGTGKNFCHHPSF